MSQPRLRRSLLGALVLLLAVAGGALVWQNNPWATPAAAPVPSAAFTVAAPTPEPVATATANADSLDRGEVVAAETQAADTLLIPAIGAYAGLTTERTIDGAMTLPADVARAGRNVDTAPLAASEGTTVIAGHVAWRGRAGALHDLARLQPGARAWTRDADGRLRGWMLGSLTLYRKESLHTALFATDGPRRLAVVTCGGEVVRRTDGLHYDSNVVAVFLPLD